MEEEENLSVTSSRSSLLLSRKIHILCSGLNPSLPIIRRKRMAGVRFEKKEVKLQKKGLMKKDETRLFRQRCWSKQGGFFEDKKKKKNNFNAHAGFSALFSAL